MLFVLTLLAGCSNVGSLPFNGGGARLASGLVASPDTGDTGDTGSGGDTGTDAGAPEILSGTAGYTVDEASRVYILAGIAIDDAEEDVVGGKIFFTILADGEAIGDDQRTITDDASADPVTEAVLGDGTITFTTDEVEEGATHTLNPVFVRDSANNRSNEIEIDVTGD